MPKISNRKNAQIHLSISHLLHGMPRKMQKFADNFVYIMS